MIILYDHIQPWNYLLNRRSLNKYHITEFYKWYAKLLYIFISFIIIFFSASQNFWKLMNSCIKSCYSKKILLWDFGATSTATFQMYISLLQIDIIIILLLNIWLGENISPAINDNNKTALDHYTINLPSGNDLIC